MKKIYLSLLTGLIFMAPIFLVAAAGINTVVTFKGEMAKSVYYALDVEEINADQNESDFEGKLWKKEIAGLNCYMRDPHADSDFDCIFDSKVLSYSNQAQYVFDSLNITPERSFSEEIEIFTKNVAGFVCVKKIQGFHAQYSCDVNL